jgi:Predicted membrane protein
MPDFTDPPDLKTALKRLAAVRVEALQAVEVLWTPQEEGDVLTQTELLRDYPILVNL